MSGFHPQGSHELRDKITVNGKSLLAKVIPLAPQYDSRAFQGGMVHPQVLYRVWVRAGMCFSGEDQITWRGGAYHLVTPPLLLSKNRWIYFLMEEDLS